ncbi:hypothetical protein Droror1_Dr00023657 [Drosera rotundifolia]
MTWIIDHATRCSSSLAKYQGKYLELTSWLNVARSIYLGLQCRERTICSTILYYSLLSGHFLTDSKTIKRKNPCRLLKLFTTAATFNSLLIGSFVNPFHSSIIDFGMF